MKCINVKCEGKPAYDIVIESGFGGLSEAFNKLEINDATGSSEESLLFAGYDEKTGETIVKSKNMTVEKYLVVGKHTRFEDYNDENGEAWTGTFWLE